jgi:proteasome accessory factor B
VTAGDAALLPLWDAVRVRRPVRFDYRKPGEETPATRHLEPWGVVSWRGRWYAVGRDRDRDATRVFRLSRIVGEVAPDGDPGGYEVPAGTDPLGLVDRTVGDAPAGTATVRLAPGRAWSLRRRGRPVGDDPDLITLDVVDEEGLAGEIAAAGPDAVAVSPPDLVAAVRRRLVGVLAAHPEEGGR